VSYRRVGSFKTANAFRQHLASVGADIELDDEVLVGDDAPLAQPLTLRAGGWKGRVIGNRFAVLPMEGWDGTSDGHPSDLTFRRWENFGRSGAKLIWGGEAVAVRHDGRANPNQLVATERHTAALSELRKRLLSVHEEHHGRVDDVLIGLQLTHSGRFARPDADRRLKPLVLYPHPILDARLKSVGAELHVMGDEEVGALVTDFVEAARVAFEAGFDFVDIKHCHGYLGHEFLSATKRPGAYGGALANRTRFLREVVHGIRREAPGLELAVRLSAFDFVPFEKSESDVGTPCETDTAYTHAFGSDASGTDVDLREPRALLSLLESWGIELVCITAGSPYYNPHIQRPALFPPSDGYLPPNDPLVDVARQMRVVRELKASHPNLIHVGSGYSYLQDWLPNVAQREVRTGGVDSVGLGRMMLSYPRLPSDVLSGTPLSRAKICRTFSDCTTAPRMGFVSGCYPLDPLYKARPERKLLKVSR